MSERFTTSRVRSLADAVNAALTRAGAPRRVVVQGRNGYTGLDEADTAGGIIRTIAAGSSREIGAHLRGMLEALWMLEAPR